MRQKLFSLTLWSISIALLSVVRSNPEHGSKYLKLSNSLQMDMARTLTNLRPPSKINSYIYDSIKLIMGANYHTEAPFGLNMDLLVDLNFDHIFIYGSGNVNINDSNRKANETKKSVNKSSEFSPAVSTSNISTLSNRSEYITGLTCDEYHFCAPKSKKLVRKQFKNYSYMIEEVYTVLRFTPLYMQPDFPAYKALPIYLVNNSGPIGNDSLSNWISEVGRYGVFGLGYSSPIWNYVDKAYETGLNSVVFAISYTLKGALEDHAYKDKRKYLSGTLSFNERRYSSSPLLVRNQKNNTRGWYFSNMSYSVFESPKPKRKAFIDLQEDVYIQVLDRKDTIEGLNQLLCGKLMCPLKESDLSKLPPLILEFYGETPNSDTGVNSETTFLNISILPEEYTYFDSNGFSQFLIGQFRAPQTDLEADDQDLVLDLGLGKRLFSKVELVLQAKHIRTKKDLAFFVGLCKVTPPTNVFMYILNGANFMINVLLCLLCFWFFQKSKKELNKKALAGGDYMEAENEKAIFGNKDFKTNESDSGWRKDTFDDGGEAFTPYMDKSQN